MNYVLLIVMFFPVLLFSQAGASVYAGPVTGFSPDGNITASGQGHYGWAAGLDARIAGDDMYFMIGAQYQKLSLISSSQPAFFDNDWTIAAGRCGIGGTLFHLSSVSRIRAKALASFNFNLEAPSGALNIPGYTRLNDSHLGAVGGLGLSIGILDIDFEYQHGIINVYNDQPKSIFHSVAIFLGLNF
jgi:hypothetical protein